jgi:shikimate kinase
MPQCGKSTVGKLVAEKIGYLFKDIDRMIEEAYCQKRMSPLSCPEIYKKEGPDYFRNLEQDVFNKAMQEDHVVIATGGGTPIHTPTFNKLTANSQVFFLYCTFDVIWGRVSALKQMPALISVGNPVMSLQELYKSRLVQYLANSHHKIDASTKTPAEIAEAILSVASITV